MTTSGSVDFSANRNQIISQALGLITQAGSGLPLDDADLSDASFALNAMVKHWETTADVHVWTEAQATLFVQPGQYRYTVGSSTTTDHCTESFAETETTVEALTGATTITVDSITGIASGDYIGVVLDDGTIQWTTVNGAPSGSSITLTAALTDDVAAGNEVFAYTTKIVQPLKIFQNQARRWDYVNATETPIVPIARADYYNLPRKADRGTVTQIYYDRQLAAGYINLWMAPSDIINHVKFGWARPIQDFDTAADNPDLPQEWIQTLYFNLAVILSPKYDVPDSKFNRIQALAERFLQDMTGLDREMESVMFAPDYQGRR